MFCSYPATVILKDGQTIEGDIVYRCREYISVNSRGQALAYFFNEIESIKEDLPLAAKPVEAIPKEAVFEGPKQGIPFTAEEVYVSSFEQGLRCAMDGDFAKARKEFNNSLAKMEFTRDSWSALKIIDSLEEGSINKDYAVYLFKGVYYQAKGELDKALYLYQKALEINPAHVEAYRNIADVYAFSSQFHKAVDYYNRIIQINPKTPDVYYNLGVAYLAINDKESALASFKQAVETNPADANSYNNLGILYIEEDKPGEAVKCFNKLSELNPQDPDVFYSLGLASLKMNRPDKAVSYYEKTIQLDPSYAEAYVSLGSVQFDLGRYPEAKNNLDRAKELFASRGDNQAVREIQEYLDGFPSP